MVDQIESSNDYAQMQTNIKDALSYLGNQALADSDDVALVVGLLGLLGDVETRGGFLMGVEQRVKFVSRGRRGQEREPLRNVPMILPGRA